MPIPWASADSSLGRFVEDHSRQTLQAYRAQPSFIEEHFRLEEGVLAGGYSRRQLYELVQNAADALSDARQHGRVHVILTDEALYCANEGAPINNDGAQAILMAHLSRKGGDQIGHFGLGFKSVLNVTRTPEFFSRSGSFVFNEAWSRAQINTVVPGATSVPILRLAQAVDPIDRAKDDPTLRDLMTWATTVVRLPRNAVDSTWLVQEVQSFPEEFLLFSRQVSELILEDRATGLVRRTSVRSKRGVLLLNQAKARSAWRVFRTEVPTDGLSAQVRADDTRAKERQTLPVLWAVPARTSHRDKGLFWAFFPTESESTLSGILNAPWKTNADRLNLLEGPYNFALLDALVELVVEHFPGLADEGDPGRSLEVLPVRSRDAKNWADRYLADQLECRLRTTECIPTTRGEFSVPDRTRLRPEDVLQQPVRDWIAEHPKAERTGVWCDITIEQRERRARAERLGVQVARWPEWLQAIATPTSISSVKAALELVHCAWPYLTEATKGEIAGSEFVLTQQGALAAPASGLYLPGPVVPSVPDVQFVHESLGKDRHSRAALELFGVTVYGGDAELRSLLSQRPIDWLGAWNLAHALPHERAFRVLDEYSAQLCVRTRRGTFKPLSQVLLPGAVVAADDEVDSGVIVDSDFHEDVELLMRLGVVSEPVDGVKPSPSAEWLASYRGEAIARFLHELERVGGPRPNLDRLEFDQYRTAAPLDVLSRLSVRAKARFVSRLLPMLLQEPHWGLQHSTQPRRYPRVEVAGPICWAITHHGCLLTSQGPHPPAGCVGPELSAWQDLLPVANLEPAAARVLGLTEQMASIPPAVWGTAAAACLKTDDLKLVAAFYVESAPHFPPPDLLRCAGTEGPEVLAPDEITVTHDDNRFAALRSAGIPALLVATPEDAILLASRWRLQQGEARLTCIETDAPRPLLDVIPELADHLPERLASLMVHPCGALSIEVSGRDGCRLVDVPIARDDLRLYVSEGASNREVLEWVSREFELGIRHDAIDSIVQAAASEARRELVEQIRREATPAGKLSVALGMDRLKRHLPESVVGELARQSKLDAQSVAESALAVFGVEVLQAYADELADCDLQPPRQWGASARALDFVEELGFPAEFAGFEAPSRAPMVDVDGPVRLPPLHEFQQTLAERIRTFVSTPRRGLLSLPTGAGKTRVVVEALIRAYADWTIRGCVVWLAQSDELCEQAVEAWAQAWRGLGPLSQRLRVSRLWGATNNRVRPCDGPHVVIATYQTLINRVTRHDYAWLLEPACIVVDEAHESMAGSYTEILTAFGFTSKVTPRPLIGLTATPFRSSADEAETQWLVNRYGGHRFDLGVMPGDDPYSYLQELGVLARVEHQIIAGANVHVTALELAELTQFKRLPGAVEQRLGQDVDRNRVLVESIQQLPEDWPVLLFATSVEHAGLLAAQLSRVGVSARAISAQTDMGARRHYIEEFKAGRIRVLTNYNVLTTGFDAPAVRVLYIARPVFSRVTYQQMIGRGLRGPLNGGKEICRIVNVADNVGNFGERLAFTHFEHLWSAVPRVVSDTDELA